MNLLIYFVKLIGSGTFSAYSSSASIGLLPGQWSTTTSDFLPSEQVFYQLDVASAEFAVQAIRNQTQMPLGSQLNRDWAEKLAAGAQ